MALNPRLSEMENRLYFRRSRYQTWLVFGVVVLLALPTAVRFGIVGIGYYAKPKLDAEIARLRAAGEPVFPNDFDPPAVADGQNAALPLKKAAKSIGPQQRKYADIVKELLDHPETIPCKRDEVADIVATSAEARAFVRDARSMPGSDWGVRMRSPVVHFILPHLEAERFLAKVLAITSLHQHGSGNDAEALEAVRDMVLVGNQLDRAPTLIHHLVAGAIRALACQSLEQISPKLVISGQASEDEHGGRPATRLQVGALICELLDQEGSRRGLIRAMYGERTWQLDTVQLALQGKSDLAGGQQPGPKADEMPREPVRGLLRSLLQLDAVRMLRYTSAWAEAAKQPTWAGWKAKAPPPLGPWTKLDVVVRPLSRILVDTVYDRAGKLHFRALAQRRQAAIALAIRLFELDNGRRPGTLDELVPEYLEAVPSDPYAADGRKIGYRPDAERPVLYSINLDGVDDRGEWALHDKGGVDWDAKDLPFFLDGDRPRRATTGPATSSAPATTQ